MLTRSEIQLLRSLHDRKARQEQKRFMAEGEKIVNDLLSSGLQVHQILYTDDYHGRLRTHPLAVAIRDTDMQRITAFKTPSPVAAVFDLPETHLPDNLIFENDWILALDGISDPGNLGTLLRTAEWFGIHWVVCSQDSVDAFNPKSIQSSMGSVGRVNIAYTDLPTFLEKMPPHISIVGADMEGQDIYDTSLNAGGILVLGSEAHGLRPRVRAQIRQKVHIPRGHKGSFPESLNVAIAGSILISEICRKQKYLLKR
ncbi:MAG: TrmH family RNA methyltransferase [Bacteroidales bacterium]